MKNIVLLGSTGSIGTQTLDVVRHMPDKFSITAMAAGGGRLDLFVKQVLEFRPKMVALYNEKAAAQLKEQLHDENIKVLSGMEGLLEIVSLAEADMVVTALVGMIGIRPTIQAIRSGKDIALANKETLVCAGEYIMNQVKEYRVRMLPVDSEHCAIFQCLQGVRPEQVKKILITASGGPFRGWSREQLQTVTVAQALKHPNWAMGQKITIDSATLMNKGLEIIEARWLFDQTHIEPIVHPQSIVHSMVELVDGTVMAQLGVPDMRLPIEVAMVYPDRGPCISPTLDLVGDGPLTFEAVDEEKFPSIPMAKYALQRGGLFPAVYNAANEKAVRQFLREEIGFMDIFVSVEKALEEYDKRGGTGGAYTLEEVVAVQKMVEEEF